MNITLIVHIKITRTGIQKTCNSSAFKKLKVSEHALNKCIFLLSKHYKCHPPRTKDARMFPCVLWRVQPELAAVYPCYLRITKLVLAIRNQAEDFLSRWMRLVAYEKLFTTENYVYDCAAVTSFTCEHWSGFNFLKGSLFQLWV